jgi:uncharacterized protein with PIN domain
MTAEGKCVVCKGEVIAKVRKVFPLRGALNKQVMTFTDGWHCTKCGLKYEFRPPDETSVDS